LLHNTIYCIVSIFGKQIFSNEKAKCHWHVFVINDSRVAALAEARFRNADSLFMLTTGTGLGGGYVKSGKVILGESWKACEIGHTILYPNGRECNCGKKGCAEQYISMGVLHKYAGVKDRKEPLKLFEKSSEKVIKALEIMANGLAILIDRIFLEFDPEFTTLGVGNLQNFQCIALIEWL